AALGCLLYSTTTAQAKGQCSLIAFSAFDTNSNSSHIYVVNPDGTAIRQLTDGPQSDILPTWSADGKQLLFARSTDKQYEDAGTSVLLTAYSLAVMNADGSNLRQITPEAVFIPSILYGSRLSWSADSSTILFQSHQGILDLPGNEVIFMTHLKYDTTVRMM